MIRKAWNRALVLSLGLLIAAGAAQAANVTLIFGGTVTSAVPGNALGLTTGSAVSASATFDPAALTGVGSELLRSTDAGFGGLTVSIGSFFTDEMGDSAFGSDFPRLVFNNGAFIGFDFFQEDFACAPFVCDFAIGPAAIVGAGGSSDTPRWFAFESDESGTAFAEGFFDVENARSEVPEPGTMILLGTALIGLGVVRRRSNRNQR